MGIVRIKITPEDIRKGPVGHVDWRKFDATTEEDIARHILEDEEMAIQDAAKYARRIRRRFAMTQREFSAFLNVPLDTIRNWEQGRRLPTGAAKTLLKLIASAPEIALTTLRR